MNSAENVTTFYAIIVLGYLFLCIPFALIFRKARRLRWGAFVPIYNYAILFEIVEIPLWWMLLLLVPLVNAFVMIKTFWRLAKVFGKGNGFALATAILPAIMIWVIALDKSTYQGNVPKNGLIATI